jgi:uncharacterized RDD family membrane protein YckC
VEGVSPDPDKRFAEWYVWAKREVSTDNGVGLGVAQAAIEALEGGADEQAARLAARRSTAGHSVGLLSRIPPRRRAYAEWYDWARREIGGDRERLHAAADAAMRRLDGGGGAAEAAGVARAAVGAPSSPSEPAVGPGPQQAGTAPVPGAPAPVPGAAAPAPVAAAPAPPPPSQSEAVAAPPVVPVAPSPPTPAPAAPAEPAQAAPAPFAPVAAAPAPPPPPQLGYLARAKPLPPDAPSHAYAGFWRRLAAYLIDAALLVIGLGILLALVGAVVYFSIATSGQGIEVIALVGFGLVLVLIALGLCWLYYAGLEGSVWQGTIGKRVLRLVVTDLYGHRIGFGRATGRYFGKIPSALIVLVGFVMVAFTSRKQGLHDLIAGTVVVRQEHLALLTSPATAVQQPAPPAQPSPAPEVQHQSV